MKISVIVCTYNRSKILSAALESIAASKVPEYVDWDVLVVDNNSNDSTQEVVEAFCSTHPRRFRYLFEPKQGKSYALNTGIRAASGDILAFTDDDIVVERDWLWNLAAPLQSGDWSSSGGRIALAPFQCPPWLRIDGENSLGGVLGFFDLGNTARKSTQPFWGGNVAYRKEVFARCGLYRTDLGRRGEELLSNEDTEFSSRLLAAGERLWYEPSAIVYHAVPQDRLTKSHFLKFAYSQGRSRIRETAKRSSVFGVPRWCFSIPALAFRMLIPRVKRWLLAPDPQERFFYLWAVWGTLGMIAELPRVGAEEKNKDRMRNRNEAAPREFPGIS